MPTVHQRQRQTDGRTTYGSNIELALRASRGKPEEKNHKLHIKVLGGKAKAKNFELKAKVEAKA